MENNKTSLKYNCTMMRKDFEHMGFGLWMKSVNGQITGLSETKK